LTESAVQLTAEPERTPLTPEPHARPPRRRWFTALAQWFDADSGAGHGEQPKQLEERVDWLRCLPFIALHLGCLGVFWVGWSWTAVAVAVALYVVRMFAITGFYHRYFSHRSFTTSRFAQGVFAVMAASAAQRGPLWWAATHRAHHQHSPRQHGFWWSHIGWITSTSNFPTDYRRVKDLARYPELVFLNRFDGVVPALLALALFGLGWLLGHVYPSLGVTGPQMLVWGFFISTTVLLHGTCCINSLAHLIGRQRFETQDDSRNSLLLALITLGEGWHNNHHRYMSSVRQGLYWWEIDITYYVLRGLAALGIIWDLRPFPAQARDRSQQRSSPGGAPSAAPDREVEAFKAQQARPV
jgi:stearoyl-CoA desaturase (delta-9 desaturase)